jgi:hypothetical protein
MEHWRELRIKGVALSAFMVLIIGPEGEDD